jgi:CRP-like cAMP-binding protein
MNVETVIRQCAWLNGAPESVFERVIAAARLKQFKQKNDLYRLGDIGEFVYGIVSGFVRIKISSFDGQEFAITEFSQNDWLGEFSLAEVPTLMFEAQVLEGSSIVEIPKRIIRALADEHSIIYQNLFLEQCKRTSRMCELLSGMLFYPLRARVAGRLVWFAQHYGMQTSDGILIQKKMSQQELADLTLGSRQKVNQILKQFEHEQILGLTAKTFLVKDVNALKQKTLLSA